jgi:hypothetical protein
MNINDLASLVTVRNHIIIVMNDKSVSGKDDFRPLNEVRIKLDKKFIAALKETDLSDLFPSNVVWPVVYHQEEQLSNNNLEPEIKHENVAQLSLDLLGNNMSKVVSTIINTIPEMILDKELVVAESSLLEENRIQDFTLDQKLINTLNSLRKEVAKEDNELEETEANELASIAARVQTQKDLLKKEGRSNKRISKAKEDGITKE